MKTTVVIIEDDQEMAGFIKDLLVDEGYQALIETKGLAGLKLVEEVNPEAVLLDLKLPDIDGGTVCTKIKANNAEIQVVMITAQDSPHDMAQGLNIGADDYIPKPIVPEVLMARLRARLRSSSTVQTKLKIGDLQLNRETHQVTKAGEPVTLSAQEFKLLEYFMANPNKVLSREMILSRIWDSNPDIETRVVDVYIGYLRKKLDTSPPRLFKSVRGFGYMLQTPDEAEAKTDTAA